MFEQKTTFLPWGLSSRGQKIAFPLPPPDDVFLGANPAGDFDALDSLWAPIL